MSAPECIKNLWKNVVWKNDEEKKAFYNKYFKNHNLVKQDMIGSNNLMKEKILSYIEDNPRIKNGKIERPINVEDIEKYIKEL